ncbi:MAG: TonB-dependent receptor [Gammaproteobacteria bacterium]|nr:TonB-dependent receptor [Gammaproteobacteria bacterium]
MKFHKVVSSRAIAFGAFALLVGALGPQAFAQETEEDDNETVDEIIVEGSLNSLPTQNVGSVFGFDKTLLETPRSASTISSEQLARFDMTDIDDLVALAPGTFTQSFFGVAGSLDVRGTPGETYFRGVRRLDNPGNYPTPIGASDRIDIVRGPASPIYGPAKIGGYLNFVPKSSRADSGAYLDAPEGNMSYSTGSWNKNVLTAEVGGPMSLGDQDLGYYVYTMLEDSGSYYDNTTTQQTLIQASFDMDINDNLRVQFGGMYHDYKGNQVAGWNRLTQELIDDGTYITGTAQPLDTDGDGSISHQEYFDGCDCFQFAFRPEFADAANFDPLMALQNVGTATLKGNQVLVAADDRLDNQTVTLYMDIIYDTDSGWEFKNQLFYEGYDNLNENAYGFSQFADSSVIEDKFIVSKTFETGSLTSSIQISPSIRYTKFEHANDFINEYFDRRDLTGPSTALDRRLLATRIDDDYTEYNIGDYTDLGIGFMGDFVWESGLNALIGVRYDTIDISGRTVADKTLFGGTSPETASSTEDGVSWTASLSWKTPIGVIPYVTASEQSTLIAGQNADIDTELISGGGAFDTSDLFEYGIKGSFLDDSLYMALSIYEQERTNFSAQAIVTNTVSNTQGLEFETRWVANDNLILTFGYTNMEVVNLTTLQDGGRFSFLGAGDVPQIDPTLFYGGTLAGIPAAATKNDARRAGVPENIYTFTGTYAFNNGFAINASVVSADSVFSGFAQSIRLPSYTLVNIGVIYEAERWTFSLTGKNLTDERYFRANFPNIFGSTIVLPELPANYQAKLAFNF